jgi:hypothetical protein
VFLKIRKKFTLSLLWLVSLFCRLHFLFQKWGLGGQKHGVASLLFSDPCSRGIKRKLPGLFNNIKLSDGEESRHSRVYPLPCSCRSLPLLCSHSIEGYYVGPKNGVFWDVWIEQKFPSRSSKQRTIGILSHSGIYIRVVRCFWGTITFIFGVENSL